MRSTFIPLLLGLFFLLTSCSPEIEYVEITKEVEIEVTREIPVTQEVEVTKLVNIPVTVVVTPTFTPGPSPTPTLTSTPTVTPTFTPTPTPFNVSSCVRMKFDLPVSSKDNPLEKGLPLFEGKCVQLAYDPTISKALGFDFVTSFQVRFIKDDLTPENVSTPNRYSYVWGILDVSEEGEITLVLRRVDPQPESTWPIHQEGLYAVGNEGDIASGQWKSGLAPLESDSCYWARLRASDGDIRANHFGLGGVSVVMYENEIFETNEDCTPWYFVSP